MNYEKTVSLPDLKLIITPDLKILLALADNDQQTQDTENYAVSAGKSSLANQQVTLNAMASVGVPANFTTLETKLPTNNQSKKEINSVWAGCEDFTRNVRAQIKAGHNVASRLKEVRVGNRTYPCAVAAAAVLGVKPKRVYNAIRMGYKVAGMDASYTGNYTDMYFYQSLVTNRIYKNISTIVREEPETDILTQVKFVLAFDLSDKQIEAAVI
jgi:hypothetical protein